MNPSDLPPHYREQIKTGRATFAPHGPARIVRPTKSKKLHAEFQKVRVAAFFLAWYIPQPVTEHRFDPERMWRFDYAWPAHRVALEVEGGIWTGGRHTRGAGFVKDCEKYNRATELGWRVFRVQPGDLMAPATAKMLRRVMKESA